MAKKRSVKAVEAVDDWIENDEKMLFFARRIDHLPFGIIGMILGRTAEECQEKYESTSWSQKKYYKKRDNLQKEIYSELITTEHNKILQLRDSKNDKEALKYHLLVEELSRSIKSFPKAPPKIAKFTKPHVSDDEDMGLMLSDLHIGHRHSLDDTGGLSEYNIDIFQDRMKSLGNSVVEIAQLHSNMYKIPNLHIFSLGDIVAGMNDVGAWSNVFIETDIMTQWAIATKAIADMVYSLLGIFDNIYFYGVVGNHGRVSPKGVEKFNANWDLLTYRMLEQIFINNDRVKFIVPSTWWIKANIRNHTFLLVHGDDIKGGSNPLKGLQNYSEKWSSVINEVPNYTLAGHYHCAAESSTARGRVLLNGSFVGADVYSLKDIHDSSRPEQKIFGIHDRRGITWTYNIDLSYKHQED